MFENLVVALDGSACSARALDAALRVATLERSKLAVCSVADPAALAISVEPLVIVERALEQIRNNAQRIVDDALAKAADVGISARGCVLEGTPDREIVKYAERVGADAVVLGTHGRSGVMRLFMGSVAEGVLRHASVPVLTIRAQAHVGRVLEDRERTKP